MTMSAEAWAWIGKIAVATAIFTSGLAVQPAAAVDLKTLSSADIRGRCRSDYGMRSATRMRSTE